jgi:hypothetical protein
MNNFQTAKNLSGNAVKRRAVGGTAIYLFVLMIALFIIAAGAIIYWQRNRQIGGVGSFYPSINGKMVCLSCSRNFKNPYSYILDNEGKLVAELGRNKVFSNSDLIWCPNKGDEYITYEERKKRSLINKEPVNDLQLVLFNIKNREKKIITQPEADSNGCKIVYKRWSDDGNSIFGTKTIKSGNRWRIKSLFRQNIETGKIDEMQLETGEPNEDIYPTFTGGDKVILSKSRKDETENITFIIKDFHGSGTSTFRLPAETTQWEITKDGKSLVTMSKVFEGNMVTYRLTAEDLKTGEEKSLMAKTDLPRFSFEEAARGKQGAASIQLSPAGKWLTCTTTTSDQTTIWLINLSMGTCNKLAEYSQKKSYPYNFIFSKDETRLCAVSLPGEDNGEVKTRGRTLIEIYDCTRGKPEKIRSMQLDKKTYGYSFDFLGNDHILYIKSGGNSSFWKSDSELWVYNITDQTNKRFAWQKGR